MCDKHPEAPEKAPETLGLPTYPPKEGYIPDWYDEACELAENRLDHILSLARALHEGKLLNPKDIEFGESLLKQFAQTSSLSPRQWPWVSRLVERAYGTMPLLGNFKAILVMFRIAGENMKFARDRTDRSYSGPPKPKIRLLTDDNIFIQLTFNPEQPSLVSVYRDGWQGSGKRRFAGWIKEDKVIPFNSDRMTESMMLTINDLSRDPKAVALAMSKRIGACMYCGSRLTDEPSKAVGYGPVCAETYSLPWGNHDPEASERLFATFGL